MTDKDQPVDVKEKEEESQPWAEKPKKPFKLLGTEYDSLEAPACYIVGVILVIIGALLIYTAPQPTVGNIIPIVATSQPWNASDHSNITMPSSIATLSPTAVPSIHPTGGPGASWNPALSPEENLRLQAPPKGVVLEMFTGCLIGLFGLCSLLLGELAANKEQIRRLKKGGKP